MMLTFATFLVIQHATTTPTVATPATPSGWSIFSTHCLNCHSQGGSSPLRLDTRAVIARKAATIATVLREHFMPPWLPNSGGPFHGSRITDAERTALSAWATAGADDAPLIASIAPVATTPPALLANMTVAAGWDIPADGIHMRTFAVHSPALPDRVRAVRMTRASAAIERAMVSIDPSGSVLRLDELDPGDGAHTRGDGPISSAGSFAMLGVDSAWELPDDWSAQPGTGDLVVELHATGRGAAMPATVNISFTGGSPTDRLAEAFAAGPLGAVRIDRTDRSIRTDSSPLVVDVELGVLGLRSDERCTSICVRAIAPDGAERVLLDIPTYREGLDRPYRFDPPIPLVRGTNIRIDTVHSDELAVNHSKPMAILWCARRRTDVTEARATQSVIPLQIFDAAEVPGIMPTDGLTWFDAIAACNARSARDELPLAYRIEHVTKDPVGAHIMRAQVTCMKGKGHGWRLPQASEVVQDPNAPSDRWLWTEDAIGLSAFVLVSPRDLRRDALPPSSRIPGVWAGMTRPELATPAN